MDRALDIGLLREALDDTPNLPTPEQLREMLASAEVAAFFAAEESLPSALVTTAWNLHHVGTARRALEIYDPAQQVQANAVAAHIFDLALRDLDLSYGQQLVTTFAAQVSYIRGDRTPNASAVGRRLPRPNASIHRQPGQASLELGCAILTLNRAETMELLRTLTPQLVPEARGPLEARPASPLSSAVGVLEGSRHLQRYLTSGDSGSLETARAEYLAATNHPAAIADLDSRWVAAHLLDLCDDLGGSSVWAVLPQGAAPAAAQAMTLGEPPVLALWPPQVELLSDPNRNPLRREVRRSVFTFPTSSGKTLLAQLIIAEHLASDSSGVCVVAPTHSLCREIREGLARRLWIVRKSVRDDGPEGDPERAQASVVVMTPERLAGRLRADEEQLLSEFGLFVFDEAHLVSDPARGWTFETTVARLHELTDGRDHRLILMSAAAGGTASIRAWIDAGDVPETVTTRWRGPRRLHATYTPWEDDSTRRVVPPQGRQRVERRVTDLLGIVELFVDEGRAVARRGAPLGEVVRYGKSVDRASRAAQMRPVIELAARAGSVLTIHATKKSAEDQAAALAEVRPTVDELDSLAQLAELRLGGAHPLTTVLRRGIAYHHAALPLDVQVEIENAARDGLLDVVCATTTLAEGVNLPVRTVIVCDRGYYDGESFQTIIEPADLLNAVGRAGRAGRETEGWVVLAHQPGGPAPRGLLRQLDDDVDVRSTLTTGDALAALDTYESLIAETGALVLQDVPVDVDRFMAYCWYLADCWDVLSMETRPEVVLQGIRRTLAWQQLTDDLQRRWEHLAEQVVNLYEVTDPARRARWARSGTRLSSNAVLEQIADAVIAELPAFDEASYEIPVEVLKLIVSNGRLELLLSLIDDRDWRFKRRRYGRIDLVPVGIEDLISDWLEGVELAALVDRHLSDVDDADGGAFQFEQLSRFLTRVCEHHLPMTLGILLDWIRERTGTELCSRLPAFVHYGVSDDIALDLMVAGVRSRRLAVHVARAASDHGIARDQVRSWLSDLSPAAWRREFEAGPAEVADLLQVLRDPVARASAGLLEGEAVRVALVGAEVSTTEDARLRVEYGTKQRPRPIVVVDDAGVAIGQVAAGQHEELALLLDCGFRLVAEISHAPDSGQPQVMVRAVPE